ncbi:Fusarisetin A cluster transcription factor fsa6-like protein [Cladobotryum mycophilum]|uniref:Fusarisetin A cluster transcription factor fsa6-like protein n=1 Tax=Cladobotryum mycophilum TaxID=491253 RepID=A0ABR0S5U5_9HYPO
MPDPIAKFTTVFRATDSHRVKRNRQAVSCTACQRRKSRCDRQHPCGACEKRGGGDVCRYDASAEKSAGGARSREEVQLKLSRLEQMVKSLAASGGGPRAAAATLKDLDAQNAADNVAIGETNVLTNAAGGNYHGATSWTALVESIHDIQDILRADGDEPESTPTQEQDSVDPDVVLGGVSPITTSDVFDSLPPRQDCDRFILAYFNAKFIAVPFIHTHHFRRRYDEFWKDPSSTSPLWTSILFSILSMGAMIIGTKDSPASTPNLVIPPDSKVFMVRAAQCLVAGQYLRAKPYSVEALLMHAHARNVQKQDSDSTLWALYGLCVRLAQRRGYHRDAAKISSKMSPFEAEMRRRVWYQVQSTDLLFSFQNGMPPVVTQEACDVDHPTVLTDEDFDEFSTSLPPPRPNTDPIPILVYATKSKLCRIMRRIMRSALAVDPPPYSETLARNHELEEWHEAMPPCLRIRRISDTSFTDPNYTIMHRLMLQLMYLKCRCILHRPYLTTHKHDAMYDASRQICRSSAMGILEIQAEVDQEMNPGGRMYDDRFMMSSLTLHHFLLAAMVICLDLSESKDIGMEDRARRISMLQTAYNIWLSRSTRSTDATHASKVLRAILNKVETPAAAAVAAPSSNPPPSWMSETPSTSTYSHDHGGGGGGGGGGGEQMPSVLDMSEVNQVPPFNSSSSPSTDYPVNFDEVPSLDEFFNNSDMVDWYSLDQYVQIDSNEGAWKQVFSDMGL